MEIGSIFEIGLETLFAMEQCENITFPFMEDHALWNVEYFNTGRAAIEALLTALADSRKRIWIPAFVCTSVIDAAKRAGYEVCFYSVECSLEADMEFLDDIEIRRGDIFYVVQYFGMALPEEFLRYLNKKREEGAIIFEDMTMSLLSKKPCRLAVGDYIVGSIRKWLPIPDGAFVASLNRLPKMPRDNACYDYTLYYFAAQTMKSLYLTEPMKYNKEKFLELSDKGNHSLFSDYRIRNMSEIAYRILRSVNWEDCCGRRRANYELLYGLLKDVPQITMLKKCEDGMLPLGMFLQAEDRDGLLRHLIANGVYSNVHWRQNEGTELFAGSAYLSRHCLTIPCDQRYGKDEMYYICDTIKSFQNI